jgi:hypothetical protein
LVTKLKLTPSGASGVGMSAPYAPGGRLQPWSQFALALQLPAREGEGMIENVTTQLLELGG